MFLSRRNFSGHVFFQWVSVAALILLFSGGYFWYRSTAGTTVNAPETINNTLTTGLLGHWTFDAPDISGATATDRGTGGNNGTITGIGAKAAGKLGQALNFNGTSDYVALGTSLDISAKPFSLSAWVYRTDDSGYGTLIAKRDSYNISDMRFSWVLGPSGSPGVYFQTPTTNLIFSHETPLNTWEFLTVVVESSVTRLYVNGILNESLGSFTLGSDATAAVRIGSVPGDGDNFAGHIDDPRIYTRALSASEVYQLSTAGTATVNAPIEDPLSQGLHGYWKLDDGTGTNASDSSGNANTLAMTGSPSWTTGTIGPYALDFSGTAQYLSVADPASGVLDFGDGASFSITGWFNRDTFAADHTIVAKKNDQATGSETGYILWVENDGTNDYLFFVVYDGADAYTIYSATQFNTSGWHHFAISWEDDRGVNIYIDGKLDIYTTIGTFSNIGSIANTRAFTVGAESDGGNPFDGKLDDIRVYGYALSAGEVTKLYQTTAPTQPVDTGLVGHWTFDGPDIQGTTAIDRSSFGNNGTITGALPAKGKLGQGMSFDGTGDYVDVSYSSFNFTAANKYSWVFWVKPSGFADFSAVWFSGVSNACFSGSDLTIYVHSTTDPLQGTVTAGISMTISNSGVGGYFGIHSTNNVLSVGEWDHVVATYDGALSDDNKITIYVNGADVTDRTDVYNSASPGNFTANYTNIALTSDCAPFTGSLDDIRVYNRALSATEITNLYNIEK